MKPITFWYADLVRNRIRFLKKQKKKYTLEYINGRIDELKYILKIFEAEEKWINKEIAMRNYYSEKYGEKGAVKFYQWQLRHKAKLKAIITPRQ